MKNYLILHGHFYQPPREDPWTGLVPYQESAEPFHDWNQRITKECYAANAASRFLRYDGRIEDIINNYEVLSFNFGPTLLHWLTKHAPHIREAIVEADRRSTERNNGHGNAIAQSFNHTILPLDSEDDARLQIRWGLEDFSAHYGRAAEGMWLPETAINGKVLDLLIEEGIGYVILSPWQAKSIQADEAKEPIDLEGEPVPSWRPYRIERPNGDIAAFFYNHELASGISFEHYLQSADSLYTRLLNYHNDADPAHLVHTATDGEVYGHHEPFGDMCLAALRRHVDQNKKFEFTNYAAYLEKHPPEYRAELDLGEDKKGSSWSCFHGVSRWYKDCGCSTGGKPGWNQKWRTPLRRGFEALSKKIRDLYRERCAEITKENPEQLLSRYIDVITGKTDRHAFAESVLGDNAGDGSLREELFTLLEGNIYRMYMFTSCGWFFAELSGLEPVQNIHYAYKALSLYQRFTDEDLYDLLDDYLAKAKSNISAQGTGSDILREVSDKLPDGVEAATYFFVIMLVSGELPKTENYGYYSLQRIETGRWDERFVEARIEISDWSREKPFSFHFTAERSEEIALRIMVEDLVLEREFLLHDLPKLPRELRSKINLFLERSTEKSFSDIAASLFSEVKEAVIRAAELKASPSSIIAKTAEISLHSLLLSHLPDGDGTLSDESVSQLEELFDFSATYGIPLETEQIRTCVGEYLWSYAEKLQGGTCGPECDLILRLINSTRRGGIEPDLTIPQKVVFSHAQKWRRELNIGGEGKKTATRLSKEKKEELYRLIGICNAMGIYADDLMHRISVLETP